MILDDYNINNPQIVLHTTSNCKTTGFCTPHEFSGRAVLVNSRPIHLLSIDNKWSAITEDEFIVYSIINQ